MEINDDIKPYLISVAILSLLVCFITYCAKRWDDPPEWWPNCLRPWWNRSDNDISFDSLTVSTETDNL